MSNEMRRKDRALSHEEAIAVLERGEYGILATVDADGQPYTTPLSYMVMNGKVYFHCALKGQKLDNIAANPAVSFCVVGPTEPVYDNGFSTYYESCIVSGKVAKVTDEKERHESFLVLAKKYLPEFMDKAEDAIAKTGKASLVFTISLDRVTGKSKRRKG